MKIQFDPNLQYQKDAINAVVRIFEGQEIKQMLFSVSRTTQADVYDSEFGMGNKLELSKETLLENVQKIQLKQGLKQSSILNSKDFTIEMETGTGKTYVYLRSIFELNKTYGFTKFIIVVPSIAVKEGVLKTLQMTEQHFKGQFENIQYDYFMYNSQNRTEVRNFATSDAVQIMVINIDAFRKSFTDPSKENKANLIHRPDDRMNGMKPIEFIQATQPIVIIDEPQSVDTTAKSKEAIASLNPLCTFRYSATHKEKYNLLYKLDSIDAYEQKLVKQIEVASIRVQDGHNNAYIKLLSVNNKKSPITAKIELDISKSGKIQRVRKTVKSGVDLLTLSGERNVYEGYVINDIYCEEGSETIDFTSKPEVIRLHQAIGGVNEEEYKRLQIRKTIEEHLTKELKLKPLGLKVLSLFFIDKVANYRSYDTDGNPQQGKYAKIFEEEYLAAIKKPKYQSLFGEVDLESRVDEVHAGYFSIDKKGKLKDTKGNTLADGDIYSLIMKDKEKLLSFESKLKFIFSHSALKEGWDNPNVFQICTLNETRSLMKKRQEIGRGLRIAVNQEGERVHGFEVNTLTVMANESYEDFVNQLQKEIEDEEGIRFGVVEKHLFANIVIENDSHQESYLGAETSEKIWKYLFEEDYIDESGKVQDKLKIDLKNNSVSLPDDIKAHEGQITCTLKKVSGSLNIKDASKKETIELNKAVYLSEDFKQLWERIKYKTTFRIDFDVKKLIEQCAEKIQHDLVVGKTKFIYEKDKVKVVRGGLEGKEAQSIQYTYDAKDFVLPDVLSHLQNETNLTRKTLVTILSECGRLQDFKNNPQKFMDEVTGIIKRQMRLFIVNGIKYQKIGESNFYAQELFEDKELSGYLDKNMLTAKKSIYDYVVYDSQVESEFAKEFERNEAVKIYAKLPNWFKIETPLGSYNPDWAVLIHQEMVEKLYFVVETKGSVFSDMLRPAEEAKINCGIKHFAALSEEVRFKKVDNFKRFMDKIIR